MHRPRTHNLGKRSIILLPLLLAVAFFAVVVGSAWMIIAKPRGDVPATRSPAQPSITPSPTISTTLTPTIPASPRSSTLELLTEGKDAAIATVAQALQSRDPELLRPLPRDDVTLSPEQLGGAAQSLRREEAIRWLGDRWGAQPRVVDTQYVAHFALLRINTDGWARVEPLLRGKVTFNLYRFDDRGFQDAFAGQWRISAIVSE